MGSASWSDSRRPLGIYGTYKVTLLVDDKEVATKNMKVSPDPKFK